MQLDVIPKRFHEPDETRTMTFGKLEVVNMGGITIAVQRSTLSNRL